MRKRLSAAVFWLYLAVLFRITVFRSGWYENEFFAGSVVWVPFQIIFTYLFAGYWGYFLYLFAGNILWFVPFGVYVGAKGKSAAACVLYTALLSLTIETLQFVLSTGCSETEDILLNTLGGVLGWLACRGLRRLMEKRAARRG